MYGGYMSDHYSWRMGFFLLGAGGIVLSAGTRATIRHSLLSAGASGTVVEYGQGGAHPGSIEATDGPSALAKAGTVSGNLPFRTDPRLEDRDAARLSGFRPARGSPLVDAGTTGTPYPRRDLVGAPRAVGRGPDLGPLERVDR